MALKLKKVDYVMLSVPNVTKSLGFYTEKLGLEAGYHDNNWAELKTEGFTLALHVTDKPASAEALAAAPRIIFNSADIAADRQALLSADIQAGPLHKVAEYGDTIGVSCDFSDPDGTPLSLYAMIDRAQWETLNA